MNGRLSKGVPEEPQDAVRVADERAPGPADSGEQGATGPATSRRDFARQTLRAGGALAAVAWSAPRIETIRIAAGEEGGSPRPSTTGGGSTTTGGGSTTTTTGGGTTTTTGGGTTTTTSGSSTTVTGVGSTTTGGPGTSTTTSGSSTTVTGVGSTVPGGTTTTSPTGTSGPPVSGQGGPGGGRGPLAFTGAESRLLVLIGTLAVLLGRVIYAARNATLDRDKQQPSGQQPA